MRIDNIILEKKEEKKKIIFVDNGQDLEPFPDLTISALEKDIKKIAKDLEEPVENPIQLVNKAFEDNSVPIPGAYLTKRWAQYMDLLKVAVTALGSARGYRANWSTT